MAHTPREGSDEWHDLEAHLRQVAQDAKRFADKFGAGETAQWVGLHHDFGKYLEAFQTYLHEADAAKRAKDAGKKGVETPKRGPNHSSAGALAAYLSLFLKRQDSERWKEFALPIAAHHSGLEEPGTLASNLTELKKAKQSELAQVFRDAKKANLPTTPPVEALILPENSYHREMRIRMLLSALVDADRLDTQKHFDPDAYEARKGQLTVQELWAYFQAKQRAFTSGASESGVNRVRREVYRSCVEHGQKPQGVFRLTVPTGGGKTRSGLAFALSHAVKHNLDRVIVAIPYTSIIEQTAQVYRDIFGEGVVLEHHSQVQAPDGDGQNLESVRSRLATENWDAPLVVTTNVQLFESLFSSRASRVRKLHNIARSVIVLDEAQTLPPGIVKPTLNALRTLVEEYGVTVVLSTATQPTFDDTPYLEELNGFDIQEIVPRYREHFGLLERVTYHHHPDSLTWHDLADIVRREPRILVVLNTRKDALALLDALGDPDAFHLSTLLCGAHRKKVLDEVKAKLSAKERAVRLVSTQVIEAGVDLDFPIVYRAVAPLDRIIQAAGRCNREGKLSKNGEPAKGTVVIFEAAEGTAPRGDYAKGIQEAQTILSRRNPNDLHKPDIHREYFQSFFSVVDLDSVNDPQQSERKKKQVAIQPLRRGLNYPETSRLYRLIEDDTVPVIVPYQENGVDEWKVRLEAWQERPNRLSWQRLQPYIVNIYKWEKDKLEAALVSLSDDLYMWNDDLIGYDEQRGLKAVLSDPSDLVLYKPERNIF